MVIYKITNPLGKHYIGQTVDFNRRKQAYHNLTCEGQVKLHRSLKKYGYENHKFEVLETCSKSLANERERYYQEKYEVIENGLNLKLTRSGDKSGKLSEETKLKISHSNKGKKIKSESIEKMIKTRKERGLNKHSDLIKKKISNTLKGHNVSTETREKISKALKGRPNKALSKPVLQYNLKGEFVKEYPSLSEAKKQTGVLNIIQNIKGKYKQSGGFVWKYRN